MTTHHSAIHNQVQLSSSAARLLTAHAKARNEEVIGHVVDDSLARAAELRKEREAREAERREAEARQRRIEMAERLEQEEATRLTQERRLAETRQQAHDIAEREVERAQRLTVEPFARRIDLAA